MADLVTELSKLRYGEGIRDVLGEIGARIQENKRMEETQRVMNGLTGVDLSTPEGMTEFRKGVFSLSQMGQPGQAGLAGVQAGIIEPMQLQQAIETAKLNRLKVKAETFNKDVADYNIDLRNPNITHESLSARYPGLMARRNALVPEFGAQESMLYNVVNPKDVVIDDKAGKTIPADSYNGQKAPPGKSYQYVWSRGKWEIVKDDIGNPLLRDLPGASGSGSRNEPITSWEGDWELPDVPKGQVNEAFIASLPKQVQGVVRSMGEYRRDTGSVAGIMAGSQRQKYAAWVDKAYPGWDYTNYEGKKRSVDYYRSGKGQQNIVSLNQAVDHTGQLFEAGQKLKNFDTKMWNRIVNIGKNESGNPDVNTFKENATLVTEELARAFGGKAGTIPEIAALGDAIAAINSPEQIDQAIQKIMSLLSDRFVAEGQAWMSATGKTIQELGLLQPQTKITLYRLGRQDLIDKIEAGQEANPQDEYEQYRNK